MKNNSFDYLNKVFQDRLLPLDLLDFPPFNALKIYEHAVVYAENNSKKLIERSQFRRNLDLVLLIFRGILNSFWFRRLQNQYTSIHGGVMMIDPGRGVDDGNTKKSFYFDKLKKDIDRAYILSLVSNPGYIYPALTRKEILSRFAFPFLDTEVATIYKGLNKMKKRVEREIDKKTFDYFDSAVHVFFTQFCEYYVLFKLLKPSNILFTGHYHKEGMIAAAKMLRIPILELQHGLISSTDLYYVYNVKELRTVKTDALFADRIMLYGNYWDEVLAKGHEYPAGKRTIAGNYTLLDLDTPDPARKQQVVLITTQKNLEDDFIQYIERVKGKIASHGWKLWVKLHPLEKNSQAYIDYGKINPDIIFWNETASLSELLDVALVHITIYSTTLFDALGKGCMNFSLQGVVNQEVYAREMVEENIAYPIEMHDDPIELYHSYLRKQYTLRQIADVYAPYDPSVFRELV